MKININDFADFLKNSEWTQHTDWDVNHAEEDGTYSGVAWVISSAGDVDIIYSELYSYNKERLERAESDEIFTIEGAVIVDDDGEKVPPSEWKTKVGDYFKDIDYGKIFKL